MRGEREKYVFDREHRIKKAQKPKDMEARYVFKREQALNDF